ncbi:MAG: electron transfer flavoprotein subunit beta/FixA family protein [Chloroflexi bacterium]|nr:electron transfer flavoprotein subunit beta/FixA family protein [Chloroflexota bacterium]
MNIIVCIKQILDPEIPPSKFKVDSQAKKVIPPEGRPRKVSPFDAQAVEAALRLKGKHAAKIPAITIGQPGAADAVKHVLSMGVDEGVLVSDPAFEGSDAFGTAYILAQTIKKLGAFDLILCGRQAADWDLGIVGSALAEYLDLPVVTLARKIEAAGSILSIERVIPDGYEVVEVGMPVLITVSSELGQPRLPSGKGIIMAARQKVPVWTAMDIACDISRVGPAAARGELMALSVPEQKRRGEVVVGENAADAAARLVVRLREAKVL